MTLERAVEILRRERHRDDDYWHIGVAGVGKLCVDAWKPEDRLSEFEAIAIAEAYDRRPGRKAPAEVKRPLAPTIGD